jgi:hypothetical protein
MPAGSTLPSIQCHQARGRASSGGSTKASHSSERGSGADRVGSATLFILAATHCLQRSPLLISEIAKTNGCFRRKCVSSAAGAPDGGV